MRRARSCDAVLTLGLVEQALQAAHLEQSDNSGDVLNGMHHKLVFWCHGSVLNRLKPQPRLLHQAQCQGGPAKRPKADCTSDFRSVRVAFVVD